MVFLFCLSSLSFALSPPAMQWYVLNRDRVKLVMDERGNYYRVREPERGFPSYRYESAPQEPRRRRRPTRSSTTTRRAKPSTLHSPFRSIRHLAVFTFFLIPLAGSRSLIGSGGTAATT